MKKLIIFDLDGTLIDTLDDLTASFNFAFSKYACPLKTREDVRKVLGNGVPISLSLLMPNGVENIHYKDALSTFEKHYSTNYKNLTKPYEGTVELIKRLKEDGYKVALCTNKVQSAVEELVNLYFDNIFDYVQGDIPGIHKKPHPDMINRILETSKISKKECVYIGDTDVDEKTATNSQLDYILVTYGFRNKNELSALCPKATTADSCEEVYKIIKTGFSD